MTAGAPGDSSTAAIPLPTVAADLDATAAGESSPPASAAERQEQLARWAFLTVLAVAALAILFHYGTYRWFVADEWDFLAGRSITSADDLFRDHNQHWSTLPILVYRGLYLLFGLTTYLPYQAMAVGAHLAVVALARAVMRRSGVDPWIATAAATLLAFYGAGSDNIVWGFQIGFTGAVAFGLGQLLLALHDGPLGRRDLIGVALGLCALLSSGQAPAMIAAVGLTCLLRRGLKVAAFHTVPLAVVYVAWFLAIRPQFPSISSSRPTVGSLVQWLVSGTTGNLLGLGQSTVGAVVVAGVFVAGLAVAWMDLGRRRFVRDGAPCLALFAAMLLSQASAFPGRWFLGVDAARGSRYLYVMAVLSVPLLAFAATALARRHRLALPVLCVALLVPVPLNLDDFSPSSGYTADYFASVRQQVVKLARAPEARRAPRWVRPDPGPLAFDAVDAGFLVDAADGGLLPDEAVVPDPVFDPQIPIRFGVGQRDDPPPPGLSCTTSTDPVLLSPPVGTTMSFQGSLSVRGADAAGNPTTWPVSFDRELGTVLEITLPDQHLLFGPGGVGVPFTLCR